VLITAIVSAVRFLRLLAGGVLVLLIPIIGAALGLLVGIVATKWWLGPSDPLGVVAGGILTLFVLMPGGAVAAVAVASVLLEHS
jgi:hypothetical protein